MKVLFISHTGSLYGAHQSLLELIVRLRSTKIEPIVLGPDVDAVRSSLLSADVRYFTLPVIPRWVSDDATRSSRWLRSVANVLAGLYVALIVWLYDIDAIYTNSSVTPIGGIASTITRRPHIWHLREFVSADYGYAFDFGETRSRALIETMSKRVVATSEVLAEHHRNIVDSSRIVAIYDVIEPPGKPIPRHRIEETIPRSDPPILSIIGLLHPAKGQSEAIEAVKLLQDQGVEVHLRIVGDGDPRYLRDLQRQIDDYGLSQVVEFTGFVNDVGSVIKSSEIILTCSREALGRVTVEAMLIGTPVVGANTGATPEILEFGQAGVLYEKGDGSDLARAVHDILRRPKKRIDIAERAQELAQRRFNAEARTDELVSQVIEPCLNGD